MHHVDAQIILLLCPKSSSNANTNFCLNSCANAGGTFLLPVLTVEVGYGKTKTAVKCLIDTGSQRSYISGNIVKKLASVNDLNSHQITINTFIDSAVKSLKEICLSVDFNEGRKYPVPFFVHDDFNLRFSIDGLSLTGKNIGSKFNLVETFDSDEVYLDGLLGVDSLQYLQQCNLIPCLGGKAFKLDAGVVPFGNIDGFLFSKQLTRKYSQPLNIKEKTNSACVNKPSKPLIENSIVNFIMNPNKTNFDPLGGVVSDSFVEHNLDKMFKVDSLGITEDSSNYDETFIAKFNEDVKLKNGKYHVKLPWNDKIENVKSN